VKLSYFIQSNMKRTRKLPGNSSRGFESSLTYLTGALLISSQHASEYSVQHHAGEVPVTSGLGDIRQIAPSGASLGPLTPFAPLMGPASPRPH